MLLIVIVGCGPKEETSKEKIDVEVIPTTEPEETRVMDSRITQVLEKAEGIDVYGYKIEVVDPNEPLDFIATIYHTPEKQYYQSKGREFYVTPEGKVYEYFKTKITGKTEIVSKAVLPPDTLLKEFEDLTYAELIEPKQIIGKYETIRIEYTNKDGNKVEANIWKYRGLPVLLIEYVGDKQIRTEYDNLRVDSVRDEEVTLPADAFE